MKDGKSSSMSNGKNQRKHYKLSPPPNNMAERVSTGGTKSFHYKKGHSPQLKPEEKNEISQAYGEYYERRAHEKRNKAIKIIVIIIIIILITLGFALF